MLPSGKIKIDERTYALRMGEPVQLGTVKEIEKEFRVGRRVLARLADIGVIERVRPSPFQSMYYFADIAAFLERTRTAPAFWSSVRREALSERTFSARCLPSGCNLTFFILAAA
mgnify:CR=1 FL=1